MEQPHPLRRRKLRSQYHLVGPERRRKQLEKADEGAIIQIPQIQHGAIGHVTDDQIGGGKLIRATQAPVNGQHMIGEPLQTVGVSKRLRNGTIGKPIVEVVVRQLQFVVSTEVRKVQGELGWVVVR